MDLISLVCSKGTSSCFIFQNVLISNGLEVKLICHLLMVMKYHKMIQPCLGHGTAKIRFYSTKGTKGTLRGCICSWKNLNNWQALISSIRCVLESDSNAL